ncbi:MAG: carboxypeptidase-like regulatory domain-containing protein, partial [bacterium]
MSFAAQARGAALLAALVTSVTAVPAYAQEGAQVAPPRAERGKTVRVVGTIRDEMNAIALPGTPVEVVGTGQIVYTDVDGRYVLDVPPGTHQIKVLMDGYQERTITVEAVGQQNITVDVGLTMARYAETVTVTADVVDAQTASAEAQLIERKQSQV